MCPKFELWVIQNHFIGENGVSSLVYSICSKKTDQKTKLKIVTSLAEEI